MIPPCKYSTTSDKMCIFRCETLSLHHEKCHRTLFTARVPPARFRRRRPHAGGNRACVPGKRLVYACGHSPRRCSRRRRDAPARCAGGVAGALPRSCRRTPARAGRHGREYPAGRIFRYAVRARRRAQVPRKTIGQRYRPDGICHRVAARNRPAGSGGILRRQHIARCRDRYGQRQCQPLFPGAVCGHSRPAAR